MHIERTQQISATIPMHSNRLMKLTEAAAKLSAKIVRICIDCVEWIWGYTKQESKKPMTSNRTLEMSPELRDACLNRVKEHGRF